MQTNNPQPTDFIVVPASNFNSKVDEESQIMATVLSPIKASTLALKGYLLPKTREDAAILSRLAFFGGDISPIATMPKLAIFKARLGCANACC